MLLAGLLRQSPSLYVPYTIAQEHAVLRILPGMRTVGVRVNEGEHFICINQTLEGDEFALISLIPGGRQGRKNFGLHLGLDRTTENVPVYEVLNLKVCSLIFA